VRRITGGVETWHIYGFGGELIAEYPLDGAAGSPSKEYGYRGGQLLIVGDTTNVRWTVTDSLGTPRIVAGKTGALSDVTRHDYLPFGEELFVNMGTGSIRSTTQGYSTGGTNDGLRKKFTGYERDDETGLDFAQARYYSSRQARFLSPDEFTGGPDELFDFADIASENPTFYAELEDPQSLNKYQYCYNSPLSNVDPDGHSVWTKIVKIAVKTVKTGDAVAAVAETFQDVKTVLDSSKSLKERGIAALSLASEALPVSISDAKDLYKGVKAGINKADELIGTVGKHGDLKGLVKRSNGQIQSHHVIQDAAVKNIPGYDRNKATAVILQGPSTDRATQHGQTRGVQTQRGGGTYGAERRIGYKGLRRAGVKKADAKQAIRKADEYFESLGVTVNTPTSIPGDRR
jgi:RHS repeat-associated protein